MSDRSEPSADRRGGRAVSMSRRALLRAGCAAGAAALIGAPRADARGAARSYPQPQLVPARAKAESLLVDPDTALEAMRNTPGGTFALKPGYYDLTTWNVFKTNRPALITSADPNQRAVVRRLIVEGEGDRDGGLSVRGVDFNIIAQDYVDANTQYNHKKSMLQLGGVRDLTFQDCNWDGGINESNMIGRPICELVVMEMRGGGNVTFDGGVVRNFVSFIGGFLGDGLILRNMDVGRTWADFLQIYGGARDILVEGCSFHSPIGNYQNGWHPDFMQCWHHGSHAVGDITNVTVRGCAMFQGATSYPSWAQGFLLQQLNGGSLVNWTVEDNVFLVDSSHGFTAADPLINSRINRNVFLHDLRASKPVGEQAEVKIYQGRNVQMSDNVSGAFPLMNGVTGAGNLQLGKVRSASAYSSVFAGPNYSPQSRREAFANFRRR